MGRTAKAWCSSILPLLPVLPLLPIVITRRVSIRRMSAPSSRLFLSIVFALTCAAGAPAVAQWFHYPTADVPRLPDGKPNMKAPAPKLADGRPDLSGIWLSSKKIPCTKEMSKFIECGNEIGGSPQALSIGADIQGGLPFQPWAA